MTKLSKQQIKDRDAAASVLRNRKDDCIMVNANSNPTNENGYMVHPDSFGKMDLSTAIECAREASVDNYGIAYWVEDCNTNKTLARFLNGETQ